MASPSDLVTLATVKTWLGVPASSPDDGLLGMLVSQISRNVLSHINRASVVPKTYTETVNGNGKTALMLKNYPINQIVSVTIDGTAIPAAVGTTGCGYLLTAADDEPPGSRQSLLLRGHCFHRGMQNVAVVYMAGYQISSEAVIVATAVTVQQPYGAWASDVGVANVSTGAALTKVASAPAQGQYTLDPKVVGGYVFNAADGGLAVAISYGFIPADLASAAMEWVAERYRYKDRIGQVSKSLGGQETTSFAITNMPKQIAEILQQFSAVATF